MLRKGIAAGAVISAAAPPRCYDFHFCCRDSVVNSSVPAPEATGNFSSTSADHHHHHLLLQLPPPTCASIFFQLLAEIIVQFSVIFSTMRAGCTTAAPSLPLLPSLLIFALLKAAVASAIPSSNGRLLSINLLVLNTSIAASGPSFEAASGDNSSCTSTILGNSVLQLLTSFEDAAPAQANFRADTTVLVGLYSIMLETWSPGGGAIANRHTLQGHTPASFFLRRHTLQATSSRNA
jgi:hypothetical protein